jgi:hypothetical protein
MRSIKTLLAILNSQPLRWFFPQISAPFRGGFRSANRQFLELLPIANTSKDEDRIFEPLVDSLLVLHREFAVNPSTKNRRDPLLLAYCERILNGLVYELYFPDEVHAAGLWLFDLVGKSGFSGLVPNSIPMPNHLQHLRQLFEALHDGAHPLRIALDKLQTLDTVRIIEGKA